MNNPYAFAIILYGILTITLCFAQSAIMGSPSGMLLAVLAAGATYLYQSVIWRADLNWPFVLRFLYALTIISTIGSGVAPHVLR